MTSKNLRTALRLAALSTALLLQAPAQAGLISGSWDPVFGPALPGLSWSLHAEVLAPVACSNQSGDRAVGAAGGSGPCDGATLQAVFLRLYETGTTAPDWSLQSTYDAGPPQANTLAACALSVDGDPFYNTRCNNRYGDFFHLTGLRILEGHVIGLEATVSAIFVAINGADSNDKPESGLGNSFRVNFNLNGPELYCTTCPGGEVKSSSTGLQQFLVTYDSNDTSDPKFSNDAKQALGVRLDENGRVLGLATSIGGPITGALGQVPEPAGLALVATALAAAALVRRRRG